MDFDPQALIPPVAQWLGVDPTSALLFFGIVVAIANLIGRLIPDDAEGFLGFLRRLCKIIGLYTGNRVTSGVSTNDVARAVVGAGLHQVQDRVEDLAGDVDSLIPRVVDGATDQVVEAFPGLGKGPLRDPTTGKFFKKDS